LPQCPCIKDGTPNPETDLAWSLNDIFKEEFKTVSFNMYPIYLNLGFGYAF